MGPEFLLPRPALAVLDAACRENGVALVAVQSLGLAGTVRLSLREHCVWDSKPDTPAPDLRLDRPWPALAAHCAAAALPGDPEALRALPWAALVIRAAATWRAAHEGRAPGRTDAGAFRARLLTLAGGSGEETAEGPGSDAAVTVLRLRTVRKAVVWARDVQCAPCTASGDDEEDHLLSREIRRRQI